VRFGGLDWDVRARLGALGRASVARAGAA
jgi:hypothetical protein